MASSFFYPSWKEGGRGVSIEGRPGDYLTDRLTDEALAFIQAQKDRPFFLYLSHFAVHTFIQGKEPLVDKYRRKPNPGGPHVHPVYAAMLESVDESVGRVMRTLQDLGLAENTVVMLASDNGGEHLVQRYTKDPLPPTSNLPLREGKTTLYEGGIRVPLIVRGTRVRASAVAGASVISSDFLPTMLEMAGLAAPPANTLVRKKAVFSLVPLADAGRDVAGGFQRLRNGYLGQGQAGGISTQPYTNMGATWGAISNPLGNWELGAEPSRFPSGLRPLA